MLCGTSVKPSSTGEGTAFLISFPLLAWWNVDAKVGALAGILHHEVEATC